MKIIKQLKLAFLLSILHIQNFASAVDVNEILPPPADSTVSDHISGGYEQIDAIRNLPDVNTQEAVGAFIKTLLGWTFAIALATLFLAGIYFLVYEGEEEKIAAAKKIIKYLVIGMVVISAAYGIVSGLVTIEFF